MSSQKRKAAAHSEERYDDDDDASSPGKLDGANVNSSSARKAQNRIAQREFRLRKQQYVRDLEARVEVLSGDREERLELMTVLVRNLLKENADLRGMLRGVAGFIGEGLGSCLPRLGLTSDGLDAILSRADTDTAYEAFVALKNAREAQKDNPPVGLPTSIGEMKKKRKGTDGPSSALKKPSTHLEPMPASPPPPPATQAKRTRLNDSPTAPTDYSYLFPANAVGSSSRAPTSIPQPLQPQPPQPGQPPPPPPNLGSYDNYSMGLQMGQPPAMAIDTSSYRSFESYESVNKYYPQPEPRPLPPITSSSNQAPGLTRQQSSRSGSPSMSYQHTPVVNTPPDAQTQQSQRVREALLAFNYSDTVGKITPDMQKKLVDAIGGDNADERKQEALQLVSYHLNNFRANPNYNLPTSLMPTNMQRSVPHEHAIDGVVFPAIRERMITYRGKYDLLEAINGIITGCEIHGDDTLDHHNWEFPERWLNEFSVLTNQEVYDITNKWRAERGEPPLIRPERPKAFVDIDKILSRVEG